MKKKFIKNNLLYSFIGIILIIIIWEIISLCNNHNDMIFPSPLVVFKETFNLFTYKNTYISIINSFYKMILGYGVSIIMSFVFGVLGGLFKPFREIFNPFIVMLKSIPTASLLFLFIVLVGFNFAPVFVVILVSFPILYEAVSNGILNIPDNINDAIKIDGGDIKKSVINLKIPLAFNYIIVGIVSSFALAFKVEIMSEILAGDTNLGIGSKIKQIQGSEVSLTGVFAWSLIAIILMIIIDYLTKFIKNKINNKIN